MSGDNPFQSAADPFMAFWTDFAKRVAGAGAVPPQPAPDVMEQMRKAYLGALSEHMEQFMRSEAFLASMKQAMDNALAWQQMMNQTFQQSLSAAQAPAKADVEHVTMLVRGMEERVLDKLEKLGDRVAKLEKSGKSKS